MVSDPPSPHNMVASSFRHTPQITPQKSNYSYEVYSPGNRGGNAGLHDGQNSKPYTCSQITTQDPSLGGGHYRPSKEQGGLSGGRISRRLSRRGTAESEPPSPMPIDPGPLDPSGLRDSQVYGYAGGAGMSRTNTLGDINWPAKDVRGGGSRELLVRELVFTAAETRLGLDLSLDVDDHDEGRYWAGGPRDDRGASRSSLL